MSIRNFDQKYATFNYDKISVRFDLKTSLIYVLSSDILIRGLVSIDWYIKTLVRQKPAQAEALLSLLSFVSTIAS